MLLAVVVEVTRSPQCDMTSDRGACHWDKGRHDYRFCDLGFWMAGSGQTKRGSLSEKSCHGVDDFHPI